MKNSEAILVTPKHFEIQECPVPEPKDHEILMKVEYVGMCGSDIHGFEFGPFIPPKDPNQKIGLGHEVAGEVVKIGAKVTKFKVGDKVLIEPGVPDDTCEYCRTGRYNICPGVDFMATQPNYKGALTQYMTHPEEWTYHIPEGMTTMEGALVEPAAVGMHAAVLGGAQPGKSIVILGGGTIGLMVLQACISLGATDITVVDVIEKRLELAKKLGAARVINGKEEDTVVLHGASGIGDEDIKKAISLGIAKINIHTELCQAAMEAINEHKDEPFLAVERAVRQAVKERAMYKIKLFGDDGRADE